MTDARILTCDNRKIKWILTRKKVKNLNLRIKPDGIVYISANSRITIEYIEAFIREKSDFIFSALDHLAIRSNMPSMPKRDEIYHSGDTVRYFGNDYTLSILISDKETVMINDTKLIVHIKKEEHTGKLLEKFYTDEIKKLFDDLNQMTYDMFRAKGYNVPKANLQIRRMTSRWGSCHVTKGKIVMNSRLALYPEKCAEYVFIHEYAHFIVPNHSKAFYSLVKSLMPDYKLCVNILKQ